MTVVASSVVAMSLLRSYKCPHCGKVQDRVLPKVGVALECANCLKQFAPAAAVLERRAKRRRRK